MADIVDQRASALRNVAVDIVRQAPERNIPAQIAALRAWLARHCQFIADPVPDELLIDPRFLVAEIRQHGKAFGDCDDVAVLAATLAQAIGIPARFQVVAFDRGPLSHVYTELFDGVRWQSFDVTRPAGVDLPVRRRWTVPLHLPGGARAGLRQAALGDPLTIGGLTIDLDAPLWLGLDTKTWLAIGGGALGLLLVLRSR